MGLESIITLKDKDKDMGDFTNEDRTKLIETHTIVKSLAVTVNDHETRIRKNETMATKIAVVFSIAGAFLYAFAQTIIKKITNT